MRMRRSGLMTDDDSAREEHWRPSFAPYAAMLPLGEYERWKSDCTDAYDMMSFSKVWICSSPSLGDCLNGMNERTVLSPDWWISRYRPTSAALVIILHVVVFAAVRSVAPGLKALARMSESPLVCLPKHLLMKYPAVGDFGIGFFKVGFEEFASVNCDFGCWISYW